MPEPTNKPASLTSLRDQIDSLDDQLMDLILARADTARQIASTKRQAGLAVFDAAREEEVLQRLIRTAEQRHSQLSSAAVRSIYGAIIRECRALQAVEKVAVLGPPGSFSHLAATRYLGMNHDYRFARTISEAVDQLAAGEAGTAITPIENSFGGVVGDTLDALWQHDVKISAQLHLQIHHHLIARQPVGELSVIRSHPQVLQQCRNWLKQYAPTAALEETASSSQAVALAAAEEGAGAISSELAAALNGVPVQQHNIQDDPGNETRFFVLHCSNRLPLVAPERSNLATLMFTLPHKSGTLVDALQVLANHKVNMKHIVSRPVRTAPWEYVFEVEIELERSEAQLQEVLQALTPHTIFLRALGMYPAIVLPAS